MTYSLNRPCNIKQYARLVLALFVLSIINMAVQTPVHAAMQQFMPSSKMASQMVGQMTTEMASMVESEMLHCKCPPAMCEKVDTVSSQGAESLFSAKINHLLGFQVIYSNFVNDSHQQPSALQLSQHEWQYRQVSPPPLSISSILHI